MNKYFYYILLLIISCKSVNENLTDNISSKFFVEELQNINVLGNNPLVFIAGKEIGLYNEIKNDLNFKDLSYDHKTYIPKKSKFLNSIIRN